MLLAFKMTLQTNRAELIVTEAVPFKQSFFSWLDLLSKCL